MTRQQSVVQEDALQRFGGAGLIIGALLILLGGLLALGWASPS